MSELYKKVEVDETTPVQYVGVYVTRWHPEWGEPSVAFVADEKDIAADNAKLRELLKDNQWGGEVTVGIGDSARVESVCLYCHKLERTGHAPDCKLAAALKDEE